ncbi:HAD family hydrolase [Halomarina pelagica]|uniref:HAD family hydrolase n=1 Tax=Halomarina pelagica TaxID=2961599 RepID=UPI0020C3340E|nr:HAD family phosphatase [Halomarina sp. BND7]
MSRFRAVLFDMDGVLVDSEDHWNRVWREEVFARVEEGEPTLAEVTGRNYRESLAEIDEAYGLPGGPERFERRFETAADAVYGEAVSLTPGVPDLLDALRERGLAVGVVSSAPEAWIRTVVGRFDLDPLDVVVSAEHLDGPGKPAPGIYERAADALGVAPDDCVVIEDSENGVRAAARADATVVRFRRGGDAAPTPGTDAIAADPAELRGTLLDLVG